MRSAPRVAPASICLALALAACSAEPGSAKWCEQKKAQPKGEWSLSDAGTFAAHCLVDATTIGSKAWCENLAKKDKGKWTAEEAEAYARHCLL